MLRAEVSQWIVLPWRDDPSCSFTQAFRALAGRIGFTHHIGIKAAIGNDDKIEWIPWAPSRGMDNTPQASREEAKAVTINNLGVLTGVLKLEKPTGFACT